MPLVPQERLSPAGNSARTPTQAPPPSASVRSLHLFYRIRCGCLKTRSPGLLPDIGASHQSIVVALDVEDDTADLENARLWIRRLDVLGGVPPGVSHNIEPGLVLRTRRSDSPMAHGGQWWARVRSVPDLHRGAMGNDGDIAPRPRRTLCY